MDFLEQTNEWPVGAVAVAALVGGEVRGTKGDTSATFALASVTKLLTAATVLVAVEEESVSLDDPVAGAPAQARLANLLDHSAGLATDEPTVLADVGARRIYSNAAYDLAAHHVEAATGIEFATYMDEAICQPLGMHSTALTGPPGHGAHSSVDDLARFVLGLRNTTVLSRDSVERFSTPALDELAGVLPGYGKQDPNPWGLGAEVRGTKSPHWTSERQSAQTWGHFGRAGTFLWVDPQVDRALICLTDTPFGPWALDRWPALSRPLADI